MHPLVDQILAVLVNEPDLHKPREEDFPSRIAYLRAKTTWILHHDSRRGPPASSDQIQALQAGFRSPLPPLVIDLFLVANGGIKFTPELESVSVENALQLNAVYAEFEEEVFPVEALGRFLPLFYADKLDVGVFIGGLSHLPVFAIDVWDTRVLLMSQSLESYLAFLIESQRNGLHDPDLLQYAGEQKVLAESLEGPSSVYPLVGIEGRTEFSLFRGDHWKQILGDTAQL